MGFSVKYINKALEAVSRSKENRELLAHSKKVKIYEQHPMLSMLDAQISQTFAGVAGLVLKGDTESVKKASEKSLDLQRQRTEYLKENGIEEDDFNPDYSCKVCNDSGYVNGKLCSCVMALAKKYAIDELNEDTPLSQCRFENFSLDYYSDEPLYGGPSARETMTKICGYTVNYADNFTPQSESLFFFGKTGVGKTHISLSIVNEVVKKGYNVIYMPLGKLLRKIENEYFGNSNSGETLNSAISCDLIVLDDLGTEFSTQFTNSTIYEIINSRILSGRPTIISTNLDVEEIEKKYSQRITSRIFGCYRLFEFVGEDIRTLK
ncbi:MAG: ATP-binding protein [Clostridia bacterium]|nr:ATP-binding protein [Clostridia bacterium]MEE1025112.1 ATP-binding protein [Acutalibacteraceae bacterium]